MSISRAWVAVVIASAAGVLVWGVCDVEPAGTSNSTEPLRSGQLDDLPSPQAALHEAYRTAVAPRSPLGRTPSDRGELPFPGVTGIVSSGDGPAVGGAVVYAHLSPDRERCASETAPIATCRTDDAGRYELLVPRRKQNYRVDVGVVATGWQRTFVEDVVVSPDGAKLDVELPRGEVIRGVVTTRDGVPVGGAKILATRKFELARDPMLLTWHALDTRPLSLAARGSDYDENCGITDAGGAFEIRGLKPGEFLLVPKDGNWLWTPPRVKAGVHGIGIEARQPQGVEFEVTDAATGLPLARPNAGLEIRTADVSGRDVVFFRQGGGRRGRVLLAWDRDERWSNCGSITAKLRARGYEDSEIKLSYCQPGLERVSIALKKAEGLPLKLDVWLGDGSRFGGELVVEYAAPGSECSAGRVAARLGDDGAHVASIPRGRWFLRVQRVTDLGRLSAWNGELLSSANRSTEAVRRIPDVSLPVGGEVEIRVPADVARSAWTVEFESDSFVGRLRRRGTSGRVTGIPDGKWALSVVGLTGRHTLDVRSGQLHVVEF